ncbi:PIN domain-containing protein [Leucobacter coleopterorum]|uniref:Ribonuclease VapC n=1 Tax=Leucobacter coleopterorum TaxID=2714933 RepID=A0ABX6JYI9_9MICO|nr:PIN domain-containing protein [Leucobacter coleopterorum]QIM19389.1 PIN domain-containing protein [Leucobacter coleopterorum]
MIVLDASVLIALGNTNDVHHLRAREFFMAHLSDDLLLHPLTKAEVLLGPARRGLADFKARELAAMGIEEWVPTEGSGLRLAEIRAATGLKMPDCCVLDAAIATGSQLVTFDDALSNAAARFGLSLLLSAV